MNAMTKVEVNPPKVKTTVNVRQRKNVLYQVTYGLLKIFHAPHMKRVGEILYAGLIDIQALDGVCLTYLGKGRTVEFFIKFCYDWNTYEVLISTSRKEIEVDPKISSIDQFIGRMQAFKAIHKLVLSTTDIYSKEVTYFINSELEAELEKIVGKFSPADDKIFNRIMFKEVVYSSKGLDELKVSVHIKKVQEKPSIFKMLFNKLRGI